MFTVSRQRTLYFVLLIAVSSALFFSCAGQTLTPKDFAPFGSRTIFYHSGFVEYGVRMELQFVREEQEGTRYLALAAVDNLEGEAANRPADYYEVDIEYFFNDSTLVQSGQRLPLMDAEYQSLELLRAPLKKGARWTQEQQDAFGKTVTIDCEITKLEKRDGRSILDVSYTSIDGDRYEWRRFESGEGLVAYEKRWGEYMIGFQIVRLEGMR